MTHIITFLFLAFVGLYTVNGQCMLPASLNSNNAMWMYLSRLDDGNGGEPVALFEQFTATNRYEFEATEASLANGQPNFEFFLNDTCENYGTYKNNEFTVASMRWGFGATSRLCMEAYAVDNMLMYRGTNPVQQASTYTIDQCKSLIESRNSWSLEIKYPFDTTDPPSRMKLTDLGLYEGLYRLRYYQISGGTKTCQNELIADKDSSTAVVEDNVIRVRSCNNINEYEFPVYTDLKIIGVVTNIEVDPSGLGFNAPTGGFVALANVIKDANGKDVTYYYCGQYKFREERFTIELPTLEPNSPECYSNDAAYGEGVDTTTADVTLELLTLECESMPCMHGGTCIQLFNDFTCTCPEIYTGEICETNLCEPNPCQHGGTCMAYANTVTNCTCPIGVLGNICEVRTPCADIPCENGGVCYPTDDPRIPVGYWCQCPPYTLQANCSVIDACQDPATSCQHGGTCSMDETYTASCICTDMWSGPTCEIAEGNPCVVSSPCQNGGTCSQTPTNGFDCDCTADYTGDTCTTPTNECVQDPCLNGGVCTISQATNTFECACTSQYSGIICQIPKSATTTECANNNLCQNGGTCEVNAVTKNDFCMCLNTHTGSVCETPIVNACVTNNPCQHLGTCLIHPVSGAIVCNCPPDYEGDKCQTAIPDPCSAGPCENGGTCVGLDSSDNPICKCPSGYTDNLCSTAVTGPGGQACANAGQPCDNGGSCYSNGDTDYKCVCPPDWTGQDCSTEVVDPCDSDPCKNGATCWPTPDGYACECPDGHFGNDCSEEPATPPPDACSPASDPCQNGGTCLTANSGDIYCVCPPTHTGPQCQTLVPESVCNPSGGTSPCLNGATCWLTSSASSGYICECTDGYTGDLCGTEIVKPDPCVQTTSDPLCLNGGTCVPNPSSSTGYFCQCTLNYYGLRCETPIIGPPGPPGPPTVDCKEEIDCQNGGKCYFDGVKYGCRCGGYWAGLTCEVWSEWFIAVVVLIAILLLLLLILLILCMCYCCCGWRAGGNVHGHASATGSSYYSDLRSSKGPPSNAPSAVNFKVKPPHSLYGVQILNPN